MKDYPGYTNIKYYYSDKKTSDTFLFGESVKKNNIYGVLVGTLLLSGDGVFYFNQARGSIIVPDEFRGDQNIPMEWINNKGVKYAIDYQPYDFNDIWYKGHAMYSKELWHLVYQDIRDFQLKITLGEFKPSGKWYY